VIDAVQTLLMQHRKQFQWPVIGPGKLRDLGKFRGFKNLEANFLAQGND